ncbi:hypothetical protein CHU98_g11694 [Xylaria longipes]|nr:hypothetical protein CHU98_g11694 [Xylaria longipes]
MEVSDNSNSSRPRSGLEVNVKSAQRINSDVEILETSFEAEETENVRGGSSREKNGEVDGSSSASSLPASDVASKVDNIPDFGLREDSTDDVAKYDVVLIHGIRDSCNTVWIHENTSNWVKSQLLKDRNVNLLEFRYDINDTAPIYSEGIEGEAGRLLEDLMKMRTSRPVRAPWHNRSDASNKPSRYGIVVRLTNLMIFYNCPHRHCNLLDAHDTMIKLLSFIDTPKVPGLTALSTKARGLAEQVDMVNHRAVDAILWQHIPIVNIVSSTLPKEMEKCASAQNGNARLGSPAYYLEKNSAIVQQPLECSFFTNATHLELAQWRKEISEIGSISTIIEDYIPKSTEQYYPNSGNADTITWRYLLSECPPVRAPLAQNILESPDDQFWSWFSQQNEYQSWYDQESLGTHILHAHGSSLIDIWSDKIYHGVDMSKSWQETTLHFKFDRNDIRFDNVHGMVSYLVAQLSRRIMFVKNTGAIDDFVSFFSNSRSCSTTDLFQWILILRQQYPVRSVLYILSCIDQCKDDIVGYLHQIQDIGKHTELRFRILITSDTNTECISQLEGYPSINLDRFVAHGQYSPNGLHRRNQRLFEELSVLDSGTKALINQTVASCGSDFQLSGTILAWLASIQNPYSLGPEAIRVLRNFTKPPSPVSICMAIRASLTEILQITERGVFVIVMTALHSLSIDQIAWALISDDSGVYLADPSQRQRDAAVRIQQLLPGLYDLKHGEVHLCHDYWKPESCDVSQDKASRHAMMTRLCLGYLSTPQVQEDIENFHKADSQNDVYPAYFGNNLTAYAVKFLSLHYQLAGDKRPKQEIFNFYENRKTRMTWYNVHLRLTNNLRRPAYAKCQCLPALPVVAQTGLVDLTEMFIESEKGKENFERDMGTALIEAARHGRKEVVNRLLEETHTKAGALKDAVSFAASHGSLEPLHALVSRCAVTKDFEWPEDILHRVSWLGLTAVVEKLLEAGVTPNPAKEPQSFEGFSPLHLCMPGRHRQIAELLVQEGRVDVNAKSSSGRLALAQAARYSNPDIVTLLLRCHAGDNSDDLRFALDSGSFGAAFTAVQELLKNISTTDSESASERRIVPLITAAAFGYVKCAEALINHGANTNLLQDEMLPLHAAVYNKDIPMVKLLVEKGVDIEMQDQIDTTTKTALSIASAGLDGDLLEYLLGMGANVNHIAVGSHSPLLAAAWNGRVDNVKTLLAHGADVNAVVSVAGNWAPVNAAYDSPATLKALIEGGANINHCSRDGTVLFEASHWGFEATVELLLEYRNDLDLDKELIDEEDGGNNGMSPLCIACRYHRVGIMRLLLEAGADAQHKTRHGRFPLELCIEFAHHQELPDQALRLLLEYHPRINLKQRDNDGNTALHKIYTSTPLAIVKLLVNAGADLSTVNNKGYTALMIAFEAGNVEVCRYLFSKTGSLLGTSGTSPGLLHRAVFSANLDLIKLVMEAGADVNEIDPWTGETPLYTYLTTESPSILVVRYLVDTCKANVNLEGGELKYPIIQAYRKSDLEIIRFLIEAGANVNAKDHAGRSPIHFVYYSGHNDIDVLLDHGANLGARDKLGRTAVHYTAALGDEKEVEELLKSSKIDVDQRDDDGWTPLMWACLQRKTWNLDYVAEVLMARGADIWARGKVEDEEWSPLKLARFHGGYGEWVLERLEPADKSKPRFSYDEECQEYWNDEFHQSRRGFEWKDYYCDGCFCDCWGVRWRCKEEHPQGFDLCFRCYPHRDILHPNHEHFDRFGERFGPESEDKEPTEDDVSEDEVLGKEPQSE